MGLRVQQITKIMQELIKLGVPADPATLTVEGAVKQLIPYFKKRGKDKNAV